MITTDTRENFTWTTNLNVNPKTAEDYACLVGAASYTWIKEVKLPMSSNFEECEKWLKDNIGNSIILSMIELYREVKKELETRTVGLSDEHIQNWIKENANSVKLASNYRGNLNLVIEELTKKEEPTVAQEEAQDENIPTNDNQESTIIDVEYKEEKKKEIISDNPLELLDNVTKSLGNINDDLKNMNNKQGLNFDNRDFTTVPITKLISTDQLGNHTIENISGFVGVIASNELLKGNRISIVTNNRIFEEWKNQKRNEPHNEIIQGILSSIDTTKYSVMQIEPLHRGVWEMTVQTPEKNIKIGIDEGTILTTDVKFIKIDDEDINKRYFVPIAEKDFINNICANAYDKEYLNKINLIPHSEQLDKYMIIKPIKLDLFRMVSKIIIGNQELLKEIKEAAANDDKFVLSEKSTLKNISMENKDKTITLKNTKLNIVKKVA